MSSIITASAVLTVTIVLFGASKVKVPQALNRARKVPSFLDALWKSDHVMRDQYTAWTQLPATAGNGLT